MRRLIYIGLILVFVTVSFALFKKVPAKAPNPQVKTEMNVKENDFQIMDLEKETYLFSELRKGKKISIVEFFASWCPYCKDQLVVLNDLNKLYGFQDILITAISFDQSTKPVKDILAKYELTFPVFMGNRSLMNFFQIRGIPVTIVFDQNGEMIDQVVGFRPQAYFQKFIERVLPVD